MKVHSVSALLIILLSICGCIRRAENQVVLYAAADREFAAPILDGFERSHPGVEVGRQFDIEATKTLGLVTRIEGESTNPKCDCFWNNEILHTIRLQRQGLLQSRAWKIPAAWPKSYRADDESWVGFAARGRVLLVNTKRLSAEQDWPQSVTELAEPKWKGRCGMSNPLYGTNATHMACMATHGEQLKVPPTSSANWRSESGGIVWDKWIEAVQLNAVVLAGNKQVARAVSQGDLDWCLTDTDDAIGEKEAGREVAIIYPDQFGGGFGTLFIPNTVAVLKSAPHPVAAGMLANYLVSEKVESRLTMGNGAHFPVWPGATEKSRAASEEPVRWAEVRFDDAAGEWEAVSKRLTELFGNP